MFSQAFIDDLVMTMKENIYGPGEVISKRGEFNSILYFIT